MSNPSAAALKGGLQTADAARPLHGVQGLAYGALGLPLAFVALPLTVHLPEHYARELGVPLATVGALLLAVRATDAISDPWLGRWADQLLRQRSRCA
ncbi:MFS transporter [Ideonella paludis]|uniref:MFS transporter n=1 Tax=Ideonella paludis TaxID=1233411 RepID=UPI00363DB30F